LKILASLLSIMILSLFFTAAFASEPTILQNSPLNHPGIKWDWPIMIGNYTFKVVTISNYDMKNVTFNLNNNELIFTGNTTHSGNIAEIEIPTNLIGGNLTVVQDGKPILPIIAPGKDSSTIILKFNETGLITTTVKGTTYLPEFTGMVSFVLAASIVTFLFTRRISKV